MLKSIKLGKLLVLPYESFTNFVNLPVSILEKLSKLRNHNSQYFFEMKTSTNSFIYVGVKEFSHQLDGCIEIPSWISETIGEDYISLQLIKNIPKGKFIKLEPQEENFFQVPETDKVLEIELAKYCLLSLNQIIQMKIFDEVYKFKIIEMKTEDNEDSTLIDIINIDLNVDFENKFYKEEIKKAEDFDNKKQEVENKNQEVENKNGEVENKNQEVKKTEEFDNMVFNEESKNLEKKEVGNVLGGNPVDINFIREARIKFFEKRKEEFNKMKKIKN